MSAIRYLQGNYEIANAPPSRLTGPVWIALFSLLFLAPAQARSIATLQGRVVDPADAIVPGARIVVRSRETSTKRVTQTDNEGSYWVAALPVGTYGVVPSAPGFQTQLMEDLNIEAARTLVQDFQLQVGDISQELTVTSHANLIERAYLVM